MSKTPSPAPVTMPEEPKRYAIWCAATHGHDVMEHKSGSLVKASDYDSLRSALAAALVERDKALAAVRDAPAVGGDFDDDDLILAIERWQVKHAKIIALANKEKS